MSGRRVQRVVPGETLGGWLSLGALGAGEGPTEPAVGTLALGRGGRPAPGSSTVLAADCGGAAMAPLPTVAGLVDVTEGVLEGEAEAT